MGVNTTKAMAESGTMNISFFRCDKKNTPVLGLSNNSKFKVDERSSMFPRTFSTRKLHRNHDYLLRMVFIESSINFVAHFLPEKFDVASSLCQSNL